MGNHYNENFKKQLKKYNAKIKRLEKKYNNVEKIMLPNTIKLRETKDLSKKEIQKINKDIERFLQRGSEKLVSLNKSGVKITVYELEKVKRDVQAYNRKVDYMNKKYINEKDYFKTERIKYRDFKKLQTVEDLKSYRKDYEYINKNDYKELVEYNKIKVSKLQDYLIKNKIDVSLKNIENQYNEIEEKYSDKKYMVFRESEKQKLLDNAETLTEYINRDKSSMENYLKRLNRYEFETRNIEKQKLYKENYLKALENEFGKADKFKELKKNLKQIDFKDFFNMVADDLVVRDIKQMYKETGTIDDYFGTALTKWKNKFKEQGIKYNESKSKK